ncbi:hypothetical protein OAR04_03395 [Flavobacteriales bacterium]|nr:hypothetical protein [Flavobacteriales bacterium]
MQIISKHLLVLLLICFFISSCRSKKTFNGVEALKCNTFEDSKKTTKNKKSSKYEIVVLKDGKRISGKKKRGKRGKRGKSRLFKKR